MKLLLASAAIMIISSSASAEKVCLYTSNRWCSLFVCAFSYHMPISYVHIISYTHIIYLYHMLISYTLINDDPFYHPLPTHRLLIHPSSFPLIAIAIAIVYCNCSSSSPKILTSWSKKVVLTDSIEDGVLTTSSRLAGVSGRTAIVRISNVRVVMTGCVVLAVLPRLGGK